MIYLFDTNHCIYLMNGWGAPDSRLTPQERNTLQKFNTLLHNDVVYMDLLIASTAKYYEMILVANDKHMDILPDSFIRENWSQNG